MVYVALLRGINVGGKNRVEMSRLKVVFEKLGFNDVRTYINSGNVIFSDDSQSHSQLANRIEEAIAQEFGLDIPVVVRDNKNIQSINKTILPTWVNDITMKTDVMFLWEEYDKPDVIALLPSKPDLDEVVYLPGALVWRVDRKNVTRSGLMKLVGTDLYHKMTIRNINTLRKLAVIMH